MKIPKKTKEAAAILGVGAALAAAAILIVGKKTKNTSGFVQPGGSIDVHGGDRFVLKIPPGDYDMLGGEDLTIESESIMGGVSNVVLVARYLPTPYSVHPRFIDNTNHDRQYHIRVNVTPGTQGA